MSCKWLNVLVAAGLIGCGADTNSGGSSGGSGSPAGSGSSGTTGGAGNTGGSAAATLSCTGTSGGADGVWRMATMDVMSVTQTPTGISYHTTSAAVPAVVHDPVADDDVEVLYQLQGSSRIAYIRYARSQDVYARVTQTMVGDSSGYILMDPSGYEMLEMRSGCLEAMSVLSGDATSSSYSMTATFDRVAGAMPPAGWPPAAIDFTLGQLGVTSALRAPATAALARALRTASASSSPPMTAQAAATMISKGDCRTQSPGDCGCADLPLMKQVNAATDAELANWKATQATKPTTWAGAKADWSARIHPDSGLGTPMSTCPKDSNGIYTLGNTDGWDVTMNQCYCKNVCKSIVESTILHEGNHSSDHVLSGLHALWIQAFGSTADLARYIAEEQVASEIASHTKQSAYLKQKIADLTKQCAPAGTTVRLVPRDPTRGVPRDLSTGARFAALARRVVQGGRP